MPTPCPAGEPASSWQNAVLLPAPNCRPADTENLHHLPDGQIRDPFGQPMERRGPLGRWFVSSAGRGRRLKVQFKLGSLLLARQA